MPTMCRRADCCYNGGGLCERVIPTLNALGLCSWYYTENGQAVPRVITREDILKSRERKEANGKEVMENNDTGRKDRSSDDAGNNPDSTECNTNEPSSNPEPADTGT